MFCQKCGTQVPEGAGFCHRCGTRIDPKDTASQAASQSGTKPSNPQPAESSPGEETPSKFQLWWTRTPVAGKAFFLLGIAVIAVLLIGLVVNFWEIIFGIAIIASIIFAFVTGSKEGRSEIRRFILKGAAFLLAVGVIAYVVVVNQDFFVNLVQPGMGVRSAYLTQYSEDVTVEDAFDSFFDNPKWSTYRAGGYTYVVFSGNCEYLGERADARITFKITGEQFRAEQLDINGVEQGDLILYALLAKIYEGY